MNFLQKKISAGIFIYGAGELGQLAIDYCEACKIQILGLLDSYKKGYLLSQSNNKYFIKSPNEIDEFYKTKYLIAIAIANIEINPIISYLRKKGWEKSLPFYDITSKKRNGHPLNNGWKIGTMSKHEKSAVKYIFQKLEDKTSKKHYESFLSWHSSSQEINQKKYPIKFNERYIPPFFINAIIKSNRFKSLIDIGSHHGEIIKKLNNVNIFFKNYHLFEPDPKSRNYLYRNKLKISPKGSKLKISKKLIANSEKKLGFANNFGHCSQIWSQAKNKINTYKIDTFNFKPDLIKIHTEGSELDILMGAKQTINNFNPFLVFSIYHRREGFFSDITTPIDIFKNYKWFFRLHSFQGTGAFIYAVPD